MRPAFLARVARERARPRTFLALAAVAAVVAAAHGLAYTPVVDPHVTPDSESYTSLGEAILDGRYSTPLPARDVTAAVIPPSARGVLQRNTYRTPGYPALLALVGGGTTDHERAVLYVVQALLIGAATFVLALAVRRLWGADAGLLAAAVFAVDPYTKRYASLVLSESLAIFLVSVSTYAFVRAWQNRAPRWWAATGALLAVLTLTRPLFALALPLAVVAALLSSPDRRRRAVAAGATALAAGLLLAPWLAWTSSVNGRVLLTNYGEGWGLLLAAHGEGLHRTYSEIQGSPELGEDYFGVARFLPSAADLRRNPEAHSRYLVRADGAQRDRALELLGERLRSEPLSVAGETAYRAYFLWMAHEDWYQPSNALALLPFRVVDWALLLLAVGGAAVAWRAGGAGRALVVFLVAFTALNAAHHVEARYAMPVRGLYLALGALGALELSRRLLPARSRPITSPSSAR